MKNLKVCRGRLPLFLLMSIACVSTLFASDKNGIKDALVTASSWSIPKKVLVGGGLVVAGYAGSGLVKAQNEQAYNFLATACLIPAAPAAWDILSMDYLGLGSHENELKAGKECYLTNSNSPASIKSTVIEQQKTAVEAVEARVCKEHIRNAAVNFMLAGAAGLALRTVLGISQETFWGAAKKSVTGLGVMYCAGKFLGFSASGK